MAEAAGIVLGVASLFSTALDGFRLCRIGRDFGDDFETCQLRLDFAGLKLSRWGAAVGLDKSERSTDTLISKYPDVEINQVKSTLTQISKLFEKATKTARALTEEKDEHGMSLAAGRLHEGLQKVVARRTNLHAKDNFTTTAQWALYKRDEFNNLINGINDLTNELITTFPSELLNERQRELCEHEMKQISEDQSALPLMEKAIQDNDKLLKDALEKATSAQHHNTVHFGEGNKDQQTGVFHGNMTNNFGRS